METEKEGKGTWHEGRKEEKERDGRVNETEGEGKEPGMKEGRRKRRK